MTRHFDRRVAMLLFVWLLLSVPLTFAEPPAGRHGPGTGSRGTPSDDGSGDGPAAKKEPAVDVTREREKPQGLEAGSSLRAAPQRIVALFPQSAGLMPLFGVTTQVVGMPLAKLDASFHEGGFWQSTFPEAAQCPDVGFPGKPSLEIIVGLKPDLILIPYFHQSAERLFQLMKCPRFRMFGTFANLDQWLDAVKQFGAVVRKPDIANAYCAYVREKAAFVRQRLLARPAKAQIRPRVLRVVKMGKRYACFGARMELGNELMRLCNIEAFGAESKQGGDGIFSIEEGLAFDPDYIFIDGTTHSLSQTSAQLDEPFWAQFRAVRENRVFRVPMDDETCFVTGWYFNMPAALGLLWTAKTIYPDLFKDVDLDAEARNFYRTFFNIDRDRMVAGTRSAKEPVKNRQ